MKSLEQVVNRKVSYNTTQGRHRYLSLPTPRHYLYILYMYIYPYAQGCLTALTSSGARRRSILFTVAVSPRLKACCSSVVSCDWRLAGGSEERKKERKISQRPQSAPKWYHTTTRNKQNFANKLQQYIVLCIILVRGGTSKKGHKKGHKWPFSVCVNLKKDLNRHLRPN